MNLTSLSSCPFLDTLHCLPRAVGVPLESARVPLESNLNLVSRTSPFGAYDTHYAVLGVTITCPICYDRVDDTCISTCISICISAYSDSVRLRAPLLDGVHTKKSGRENRRLHRRSLRSRSFRRISLGVKMLAKFLRSWANDIGAYRRRRIPSSAHTVVQHRVPVW